MKYTFTTKDEDQAKILLMANEMHSILFQLKYNFARKYKNSESDEVHKVLEDLANELSEFQEV